MPKSKSQSKMNWLKRLWSLASPGSVRTGRRRSASRLQAEQLEPRIVLSAILQDIPGVNGDATVAGATATDIQLDRFDWGFGRTSSNGAKANPTDPIIFTDLAFEKIHG